MSMERGKIIARVPSSIRPTTIGGNRLNPFIENVSVIGPVKIARMYEKYCRYQKYQLTFDVDNPDNNRVYMLVACDDTWYYVASCRSFWQAILIPWAAIYGEKKFQLVDRPSFLSANSVARIREAIAAWSQTCG